MKYQSGIYAKMSHSLANKKVLFYVLSIYHEFSNNSNIAVECILMIFFMLLKLFNDLVKHNDAH